MARADQVEKTITKVMEMIRDFSMEELQELRFDLEERISELKSEGREQSLMGKEKETTISRREEWRRCGKINCRCETAGELHGPYIYEYWKEKGKTKSRYVGKEK